MHPFVCLFVCLFVTVFASCWPLSGRETQNGGRGEAGGGGIVCLHIRASLERAHAKVVERLSRLKQAAHLKGAARVRLVDEWADDNNRFLGVQGVLEYLSGHGFGQLRKRKYRRHVRLSLREIMPWGATDGRTDGWADG